MMAGRGLIFQADGMQDDGDGTAELGLQYPGLPALGLQAPPPQGDLDGWLAATRRGYGIPHEGGTPAAGGAEPPMPLTRNLPYQLPPGAKLYPDLVQPLPAPVTGRPWDIRAQPDMPPESLVDLLPNRLTAEEAAELFPGASTQSAGQGPRRAPLRPGYGQDPRVILLADASPSASGLEYIAAASGANTSRDGAPRAASPASGAGRSDAGPVPTLPQAEGLAPGPVPDPQAARDGFIRREHQQRNDAANLRDPHYQNWLRAQDRLLDAARNAGVDPGLMAQIAYKESKFDVNADAPNSSAFGYGQITAGTWRDLLREFGAQYGIPNASRLTTDQASGYRRDPLLQAEMFAQFTRKNIEKGRSLAGPDDLANVYALHVLGFPLGGPRFLAAVAANPDDPVSRGASSAAILGNPTLLGGGITLRQAYQNMGEAMRDPEALRYGSLAREAQKTRK